jgi:uncharacterized protein YjbI with pentapeptide repeats
MGSRWETPSGLSKRDRVLKALSRRKGLERLDFLEEHNHRLDLRGFQFPTVTTEGEIKFEQVEFQLVKGKVPQYKRTIVRDVDFSGAGLGNSLWTGCTFRNVLFDNADLSNFASWGCAFEQVSFKGANLRGAVFAHLKGTSAMFKDVDFSHSDLRGRIFDFPSFDNCDFSHSNLEKVDFNGSRISNCRFAGIVKDVFFRGYYASRMQLKEKFDNLSIRNPMENVDFREAKLMGVSFIDDIDLATVMFPDDDNLLIIPDQRRVYLRAREIIDSDWTGEDRRIALTLMENLFVTDRKKGQKTDVLIKTDFSEPVGEEFAERLFALLENVQKEGPQELD